MTTPYVGQIMTAGFNFAPKNWAFCNGQLMSIQQNQALFSLLGVSFGGNGSTNFQLPDMRSRSPTGSAPSVDPSWQPDPTPQGLVTGVEAVTLLPANLPAHTHAMMGVTADASNNSPAPTEFYGTSQGQPAYAPPGTGASVPLGGSPLTPSGALPHPNIQPYMTLNFCIALSGVFPSRG